MKYLIILLSYILFSNIVIGQSELNNNNNNKSIFFELAGSGGFASINYEKQFYQYRNTELTWRAGLSFSPIDPNNGTAIVFPLMLNSLIGKKSHKLELGLGQGITITTRGSFFALTTAALGYRYQSPDKHWFYRITYTPLISYLVDFQVQQWAGVSIGYTFLNNSK